MSFELRKKYPQFKRLLVLSFGPDFTEEYGHYDKALEDFCQDESSEDIQQTIHEINSYLFTLPENISMEEIRNQLRRLGNCYRYAYDGFDGVSFVEYIKDYLQNYLDKNQK